MRDYLKIVTEKDFEKAFADVSKEPRRVLIKDDTPDYRKGYYDGYHIGYSSAKKWFARGLKKQKQEFQETLASMEISAVYPLCLFEDIAENREENAAYSPALINDVLNERLTERERRVLEMRRRDMMTLEVVGERLGVTRERIRQIEAKALRKLRNPAVLKRIECVSKEEFMRVEAENELLKQKIIELESDGCETESDGCETKQISSLASKSIGYLNLSVRSYNCLFRDGIRTLEDLQNLSVDDLTRIRNLGARSAREIIDKAAEVGIQIRGGYDTEH